MPSDPQESKSPIDSLLKMDPKNLSAEQKLQVENLKKRLTENERLMLGSILCTKQYEEKNDFSQVIRNPQFMTRQFLEPIFVEKVGVQGISQIYDEINKLSYQVVPMSNLQNNKPELGKIYCSDKGSYLTIDPDGKECKGKLSRETLKEHRKKGKLNVNNPATYKDIIKDVKKNNNFSENNLELNNLLKESFPEEIIKALGPFYKQLKDGEVGDYRNPNNSQSEEVNKNNDFMGQVYFAFLSVQIMDEAAKRHPDLTLAEQTKIGAALGVAMQNGMKNHGWTDSIIEELEAEYQRNNKNDSYSHINMGEEELETKIGLIINKDNQSDYRFDDETPTEEDKLDISDYEFDDETPTQKTPSTAAEAESQQGKWSVVNASQEAKSNEKRDDSPLRSRPPSPTPTIKAPDSPGKWTQSKVSTGSGRRSDSRSQDSKTLLFQKPLSENRRPTASEKKDTKATVAPKENKGGLFFSRNAAPASKDKLENQPKEQQKASPKKHKPWKAGG